MHQLIKQVADDGSPGDCGDGEAIALQVGPADEPSLEVEHKPAFVGREPALSRFPQSQCHHSSGFSPARTRSGLTLLRRRTKVLCRISASFVSLTIYNSHHDDPKVRKAVFPAAGLGTRFLPATKAQPKEMLPLVDKPLIQYGVEEAMSSGHPEHHHRHRARQDRHRRSFRQELRAGTPAREPQQNRVAPVRPRHLRHDRSQLRTPEGGARARAMPILRAKELVGPEPFAAVLSDDVIDAPSRRVSASCSTSTSTSAPRCWH